MRDELLITRALFGMRWILVLYIANACVERVELNVPPPQSLIVIEGMITTDAPPYTVKVSRGFALDADTVPFNPVEKLTIQLFDDQGNSESFVEKTAGEYISSGFIQGQIGHSYHIKVQTPDGKIFESEPDLLKPVGQITAISYEYERRIKKNEINEENIDLFNIYVDADAGPEKENGNYVRWKFTGTYKVETNPEKYMRWQPPYTPYKDPWPCSGYQIIEGPMGSGGTLVQVAECTCCTCWVNEFENLPQVSDMQFTLNNQFKHYKVAEVVISNLTFSDKYLIEIEQLSLSKSAFEFYKLIRKQKEELASLFQPPPGVINGNFNSINNDDLVVGFFGASSITKRHFFIYPDQIPFKLQTPYFAGSIPCTFLTNASTSKPILWE